MRGIAGTGSKQQLVLSLKMKCLTGKCGHHRLSSTVTTSGPVRTDKTNTEKTTTDSGRLTESDSSLDQSGSEYVGSDSDGSDSDGSDSDAESNCPICVYSFAFREQGQWVTVNYGTLFYRPGCGCPV